MAIENAAFCRASLARSTLQASSRTFKPSSKAVEAREAGRLDVLIADTVERAALLIRGAQMRQRRHVRSDRAMV